MSEYELNGIQESDFLAWKHHPVTKVVLRYLLDYERMVAEQAVQALRSVSAAPEAFKMGVFQGEINTYAKIAELSFAELVEFYPSSEEESENDDAT